MSLTLSIWVFVYGTETNKEAKALYLLDTNSNITTGHDTYDGMV